MKIKIKSQKELEFQDKMFSKAFGNPSTLGVEHWSNIDLADKVVEVTPRPGLGPNGFYYVYDNGKHNITIRTDEVEKIVEYDEVTV